MLNGYKKIIYECTNITTFLYELLNILLYCIIIFHSKKYYLYKIYHIYIYIYTNNNKNPIFLPY